MIEEVPPLVDFLISQYDLGLGCERDFCSFSRQEGGGCSIPPHQGESFIQYISKSIYMYVYIYIYIYIYIKHAEWVKQPSKKYLVSIT